MKDDLILKWCGMSFRRQREHRQWALLLAAFEHSAHFKD
jgi:hypothetical protein